MANKGTGEAFTCSERHPVPELVIARLEALPCRCHFSSQPAKLYEQVLLAVLRHTEPLLRRLELGGMTFSSARRMEDFIVRHGRTLTSLVLDSCPMHVELDPPQPPARTWTDVCNRFNEELQALVDFDIVVYAFAFFKEPEDALRAGGVQPEGC